MKKYLLLAITCMLALASCDNKDEPNKDPLANDPVNIYVSFIENNQDFIYSLDGELIFQTEPGKRIMYLTAEGQDWYAVLNNQSILKNGVPIYSADRKTGINGLAVYHGDYYTLEAEPLYTSILMPPHISVTGGPLIKMAPYSTFWLSIWVKHLSVI